MIKKIVGGVWKKKNRLWIVINGQGYNAYENKNKKENQPDYQISVIEKAEE